jgi:NADH-quinone oxidoreductase subunit G
MVELTIDGHKVEMPEGSMVMHAVEKLSQYVPHFCYHKKLSIAANCRMCLVEVEKAPKPLPACATPVSQGMIVHTASAKAKAAQEGVMEFLLINHPLDCPICDQGGECQLQDLAVGYGKSESRYEEDKRVVETKDAGALISMEEMSRCIHCTRCVRFGQEVAGVMELGMLGRGEHAEITTFLGKGIDSELSGNMIDLCPVGALTSKPFRYQARTWELSRRKGVSVHDSLGSNLTVQVKAGKVMRVLPLENEAINECWISDRDRFAYEGLNSNDRLTQPMIKRNGVWETTSWDAALAEAASILKTSGAQSAALAHAMSSLEELYGVQQLLAGLGSNNVGFNLRATDASLDASRVGVPWLGMPVADVSSLDRALVIGSFLRKDQPLLATRLRAATKRGAQINLVHVNDDDVLMQVKAKLIVKPSALVDAVAQIAAAIAVIKEVAAPLPKSEETTPSADANAIAQSLCSGEKKAVWLGQVSLSHAQASSIAALAQFIATQTGAVLGTLVQEANAVGAYALGLKTVSSPVNVLYNIEPALDCGALPAFANQVVAFTVFRSAVDQYATVMLPIAPTTEAGGTFISLEARTQTMNPSVKPLGEAKPGWKVLKVLGEAIGMSCFSYETLDEAKAQALVAVGDVAGKLNNASNSVAKAGFSSKALERVADVPAYSSDAIVRRADSLQRTAEGAAPTARMHSRTMANLGLQDGQTTKIGATTGSVTINAERDDSVPILAVRISTARAETVALGNTLTLTVEAA